MGRTVSGCSHAPCLLGTKDKTDCSVSTKHEENKQGKRRKLEGRQAQLESKHKVKRLPSYLHKGKKDFLAFILKLGGVFFLSAVQEKCAVSQLRVGFAVQALEGGLEGCSLRQPCPGLLLLAVGHIKSTGFAVPPQNLAGFWGLGRQH